MKKTPLGFNIKLYKCAVAPPLDLLRHLPDHKLVYYMLHGSDVKTSLLMAALIHI